MIPNLDSVLSVTFPSSPIRQSPLPNPYELLWAALGTILTVMGTLLPVTLPASWTLGVGDWQLAGYTFSFQAIGWLLAAFLGGTRAAFLSQVGYLVLGVMGYNVFIKGGGAAYILSPAFGYLLGFLPGAWLCGRLLPRDRRPNIKDLFAAGAVGLLAMHAAGIGYLLAQLGRVQIWDSILQFSLYPLLGQFLVLLAATLLGAILQVVMFL